MRYKEIDINIKAVPDKEDEEIVGELFGEGITKEEKDKFDRAASKI